MPSTQIEWAKVEITDFSGGENLNKSPVLLSGEKAPNNEVVRALNVVLDERGAAKKRNGYDEVVASAITGATGIDFIYRFETSTVTTTVIAVTTAANSKVFKFDGTTFTEITGGSNLLPGYRVRMIAYRDYLLIYNGNVWQYWDGSGTKADVVFKAGSVTVAPRIIEASDDKLFVVDNTSAYRYTVFFSIAGGWTTDPGTDMEFAAGDDIAILQENTDSTGITALWNYGNQDSLFTFTNNTLYTLYGADALDYSNSIGSKIAGAASQNCICETDNGMLFFVGNNQIYVFDGQQIIPIGDNVITRLRGKSLEYATCSYVPEIDSVLVHLNDITLVWHKTAGGAYGGWTEWDISNISASTVYLDSAANEYIFGFVGDGHLYKYTGTDDNGEDIAFEIQLPVYTLGEFMTEKEVRNVWAFCDTSLETPLTADVISTSCTDGTHGATELVEMLQDGPMWDSVYWDSFYWDDAMPKIGKANCVDQIRGQAFSAVLRADDTNAVTVYGIGLELKALNTL